MKEILMSAIALLESIRPLKDTYLNDTISSVVRQLTEKFLEDSLANCGGLSYGLTSEEKELADKRTWMEDSSKEDGGYYWNSGKIGAIKLVRARLNLGLKEAKDLVDGYIDRDGGAMARQLRVGK